MPPDLIALLWKAVPLLIALGGAAWTWHRRRRMRDSRGRLPAVVDALGNPLPGSLVSETTVDGTTYQVEQNPGSDTAPAYLVLTVLGQLGGDFAIRKSGDKTGLARMLKQRGIEYVLSGDADFDRDFDVTTDHSPNYVSACLGEPSIRDAIRGVFRCGFAAIRNDGKGVDIVRYDETFDSIQAIAPAATNKGNLEEQKPDASPIITLQTTDPAVLEYLRTIFNQSEMIQTVTVVGIVPERLMWPLILIAPATLVLLGFFAVLISFSYGAKHVGDVSTWPEFLIAGVCMSIWVPIGFRYLRGRCGSVMHRVAFTMFSLFGWFGVIFTLGLSLNVVLDGQPETTIVRPILGVRPTRGMDTGVDVWVESWFESDEMEQIFVSHAELSKFSISLDDADRLQIKTKPGFFHREWIVDLEPLEATP